jgi:hypothetical protein
MAAGRWSRARPTSRREGPANRADRRSLLPSRELSGASVALGDWIEHRRGENRFHME